MHTVRLVTLLALAILATIGCATPPGMRYHGGGEPGASALDRGLKEMAALIEKTVQDPEKAKQAQRIVEEIVAEVKQSKQQNQQFHQQLYKLNENYEAVPDEFTKILDDLNNNRMRSATKILGLRFKMKALLTAQEWKALSEGMAMSRSRYRHRT
jgi:septal ring factor EnvC (AmiA/AmiB activator)